VKQRRKKAGYGAGTLRRRIDELILEAHQMGQDGRMVESDSLEVMSLLAKAREKARPRYEHG
jgi:hypothetical protein